MLEAALRIPVGLLFGAIAVPRDLIVLDGFDGQGPHRRQPAQRRDQFRRRPSRRDLLSAYLDGWKRKQINPVIQTGGTLTVADNMMSGLRVSGLLAQRLGVGDPRPRSGRPIRLPRLARMERNEIWAEKSVLPARYAFVDGNRFMGGGPQSEQLLVIVPRTGDNDPTAKTVGNSGPGSSTIVSTGFPDEIANRPLVVRF